MTRCYLCKSNNVYELDRMMTCIDCGLELYPVFGLWHGWEATHVNTEGLKIKQRLDMVSDIIRKYTNWVKACNDISDEIERKFKKFEKLKNDGVDLQRKTFPREIAVKKLLIDYGVMSYVPKRNEDKVFQWLEDLDKRAQ